MRYPWLEACVELGIECPSQTYDGPDEAIPDFVVSHNLHRRHLNESQRAMVAAKLATMKQGRPGKKAPIGAFSQDAAAEALKVGKGSVDRAARVLKSGDKALIAAVSEGKKSVSAAVKELAVPRGGGKTRAPAAASEAPAAPSGPRLVHDADLELVGQVCNLVNRLRDVAQKIDPATLRGKFPAGDLVNLRNSLVPAKDFLVSLHAAHVAAEAKENAAGGARLLEMPDGVPVRQDAGQRAPEVLFPRGAARTVELAA